MLSRQTYTYKAIISFLCLALIIPTLVTTSTHAASGSQYNYDIYGVQNGSCYEGADVFVRRYEAATTTTVFQQYTFSGCSYQMVGEIYDLYKTGYNRTPSGDGMKYFVKTGGYVDEYLRPVAYNKVKGAKITSTVAPDGTYPDNGIHKDGYWYVKTSRVNSVPILSITSSGDKSINLKQGQDTFTLTGTTSDADDEALILSATIGGVTKKTLISSAATTKNWTLTWRTSEFSASGTYTGIKVNVSDGVGGEAEATYSGVLTVNKTQLFYWDKYSVKQNPVYNLTWSAYNGGTNTVSLENSATYYTEFTFDKNTGRAYVNSDSAVSGFEAKSQFLPEVYKSYGSDGVFKYTKASSGSTGTKYWQYNSSTNVNGSVPAKDQLLQSNLLELDGTYPDNGVHNDGFWYIKKSTTNMSPVVSVDNSDITVSRSTSKISLSGAASDADGDKITIAATLAGVTKSTSVTGSGGWKLEWTANEVPDGFYTVIPIQGSDGKEGNDTITYNGTITVDTTAPDQPTVTITPSGEWANETVTVTLTPGIDDGVGTEKTQYKLNDGAWEDYLGPIVLSEEGLYELKAVSIDKLGNVGTELQQTIRIDKTVPGRPDVFLSSDVWTKQDVTINITHGSDAGSGADYSEYSQDGVNWTKYTAPVVVKESGEWTYQAYTVDKAGNKGEASQVIVRIDKEAPTTPTLHLSNETFTQDPVKVTLTDGQDDLSGVSISQIKIGAAGNWTTYTDAFEVDEEGVTDIWARTIDVAGNISPEAHAQVFIDRTAPTAPTYTVTDTSWSNQDVSFELGGSQDATPVTYEYKIDNGTYIASDQATLSDSGEHTIKARAIDGVGLTSSEIQFTIRIDKELPEATMTPDGMAWSTQGEAVQITATDRLSGVADPIYFEVSQSASPSGSWQVLPSNGQVNVDGEGTWYVHTMVSDQAGNVSTITSQPYQLQEVPDVPVLDATPLSASEVRIRWNLPSNRYTAGYTYTVKNLNTGTETTLDYPINEYVERNLTGGQTYAYRLRVNNHVGSAEASAEALTYPDSPGVEISPLYRTPGEMKVTIDPVTSATEYRLVLSDNQGQTQQDNTISATQDLLTGLSAGSLYTLQVSALNSSGESVATSTGFLTLPTTPTGFTAVEIKEDSIKTQWQSVTTATYYDLYRDNDLLFNGGEQDLSYEDTGLTAGTGYAYSIAAGNDTGEGELSDPLDVLTLPAQVKSLNLHSYSTIGFSAQWDGVQSAHTYHLQVFDLNGLPVADYQGPDLHHEVTGLAAGTEYTVSLVAINNTGQGTAQVLRALTLPEQVGSVQVTGIEETQAEVQLSSVTGATVFKIELQDGTEYVTTDLNYMMTQLKGSTAYTGTVQAGNSSGFGVPLSFNFMTKPTQLSKLQVETVGENELVLSWEEDITADRYWVTDEQGNITDVTDTSIRIPDLQPGTEYRFTVATENATGMGKSSEIVWSTKTEAPNLLQVDAEYSEADLVWTAPHGAQQYLLKDEATGHVYYNGAEAAAHLTQLQVGHAYDLTLYAINKTGDASKGVRVQLVTKADLNEANAKITDVQSGSVTIELQTAGQVVQEYVIIRDGQEIATLDAGGGQVIYKDTDVKPGTAYEYEIVPVNQGGEGKGIKLTTTTTTDPVSVADLEVETGNNWAEIRFPEVDHAHEYVVIDDEGTELWRGDTLPIRIDGLNPGTSYPVQIVVENTEGIPSVAVPVELWTLPLAPTNITATSTTSTVTLDFKLVNTKGITEFVIYRADKEIGRVKVGETSFIDTGLKPNIMYEYQVKALNAGGLSTEAASVKVTTKMEQVPSGSGGDGSQPINPIPNTNDREEDIPTVEESNDSEIPLRDNGVFKDISSNFAKTEIDSLASAGIIKGIKFDIFAPDQFITRMEFAALIVRTLAASPNDTVKLTFEDINEQAWYMSELNAAITNGIAKGFSSSEFRPTALINREQATKMLMNVFNTEGSVNTVATTKRFSDEKSIAVWALENVKMASEQNMVQGYQDGTFRPKNSLTRAEAAALVYRLRESIIN